MSDVTAQSVMSQRFHSFLPDAEAPTVSFSLKVLSVDHMTHGVIMAACIM